MAVEKHDHVILLGDLNFRLENVNKKEIIQFLE
jgi:hypothetical protein